jgi:hypothetical protein
VSDPYPLKDESARASGPESAVWTAPALLPPLLPFFTEAASSHVPVLSRPEVVIDVIRTAAAAVLANTMARETEGNEAPMGA